MYGITDNSKKCQIINQIVHHRYYVLEIVDTRYINLAQLFMLGEQLDCYLYAPFSL